MTNTGSCECCKICLRYKRVPLRHHSFHVGLRIKILSVSPFVHDFVQVLAHIHLFKESGSDPWLEYEPATKVYPSDNSISTTSCSGKIGCFSDDVGEKEKEKFKSCHYRWRCTFSGSCL